MATDIFGNPLDEEELRRQYLHQVAMGIAPHPARTKGLATPPSVDYNKVMQDWSDPVMLSAPAFDAPRPTNVQTSGISPTWNTDAVAFGNQGVRSFNYSRPSPLPVTPPGTMNMKDFIDKYGPVQSGTRDAYYTNDGVRNAAGDLVSTDTTFDPTGGLAATDPNLQGVTPTSTVSTGLYSEAGVPMSNENLSWFGAAPVPTSPSMNVDYGPALQAIDVVIPPADLGVTTQPTTPSYPSGITPTDSIIPVADLGGNDSIAVQTQVDDFSDMPSWDTSAVSTVGTTEDKGPTLSKALQGDYSQGSIDDYLSTWDKINRLGNTSIWGTQLQDYKIDPTTGLPFNAVVNYPGTMLDTPSDWDALFMSMWDHPYLSSEDATYSQGLKQQMAYEMFGPLGAAAYGAGQTLDETKKQIQDWLNDTQTSTNILPQIAPGINAPPGVRELVDTLIEKNVLGITTPDVTPTTFDSTPTVTTPAVTTPAVTTPTGPTRAELKAAAVAQRKADAKARKAAARRTKIARQALKDSQAAADRAAAASAAQASRARTRAQAVLDKARSTDRGGPSQAEINAAIEVMSQVDTFGGGSIGFDGVGFDPQGGETGSSGMGAWT